MSYGARFTNFPFLKTKICTYCTALGHIIWSAELDFERAREWSIFVQHNILPHNFVQNMKST